MWQSLLELLIPSKYIGTLVLECYLVKSKEHEKLKIIPALQRQQQPQTKKESFDSFTGNIAAACTGEFAITVAAAAV